MAEDRCALESANGKARNSCKFLLMLSKNCIIGLNLPEI